MTQNTEIQAKLRWRCHRGMLELDLMLLTFFDKSFTSLTAAQQQSFERLLACTDPELYAWLIGAEHPEEEEFAKLVDLIRTQQNT